MLKRSVLPVLILLAAGLMTAHGMTGAGGAEPETVYAAGQTGTGSFIIGSGPVEALVKSNEPEPPAPTPGIDSPPATPEPEPTPRRIELIGADAGEECSPESSWLAALRDEVNGLSGGSLTVDLHPAGTLGNEAALIRRTRENEIDIVACPLGALVETVPELSVLETPLLFEGAERETALSALNGDNAVRKQLQKAFGEKGLTLLGILPGEKLCTAVWGGVSGFSKSAKGLRVAIPSASAFAAYWKDLGAKPKRCAPEAMAGAVSGGAADAAEGTARELISAGVAGEGFTLVPTDHGLSFTVLFIGSETFKMLPEEYRDALLEAVGRSLVSEDTRIASLDAEALASLLGTGIRQYTGKIPHADSGSFKGKAATVRKLIGQAG